jgi:hypothetical protein
MCSWPGTDPASWSKIRWIYKSASGGKQELAGEDDAISATLNASGRIGMELSPSAQQAGWTGLVIGPEGRMQNVALKPLLEDQFYDGHRLWVMLLLPLLLGIVELCFVLSGLIWMADWIAYAPWRAQRYPWEEPQPSLFEKWTKKFKKIRSRFSEISRHDTRIAAPKVLATAQSVAVPEPQKKPPETLFLPFDATDGMAREGFMWDKTKEIE